MHRGGIPRVCEFASPEKSKFLDTVRLFVSFDLLFIF